jgi:hypothetical protein
VQVFFLTANVDFISGHLLEQFTLIWALKMYHKTWTGGMLDPTVKWFAVHWMVLMVTEGITIYNFFLSIRRDRPT